MIFNASGGGGSSLNFKVVGSITEPISPTNNMIWINTDYEITSWVFSSTEPEKKIDGMVWITVGMSGKVSFNALKKNSINIYPIAAKHRIGDLWVDRVAKSYQKNSDIENGEWVEWINGDLYKNGKIGDVGGELIVELVPISSSASSTNKPSIAYENDYIKITQEYGGSIVRFKNKVDLTYFKTLYFDGILWSDDEDLPGRCYIGIWSEIGPTQQVNLVIDLKSDQQESVRSIDISAITTESNNKYYIGFGLYANNNTYVKINRMWLE